MMEVVSVYQLSKECDLGKTKVRALCEVNLHVNKGEFIAIAGASGSGKSTLLNLIGGLDEPSRGTVKIDGVFINGSREQYLNRLRLKTIGFIFQSFNLIPVLNVFENIEIPLLIRKDINKKERKSRIRRIVGQMGLKNR